MDEEEKTLCENFLEYYDSAEESLKKKRFNAATTLFFKAIAAGCDLIIYRDEQMIPKSHAERFRILEQRYPKIYGIADKDFPFYQNSYTNKMDEETAKLMREDAQTIIKKIKL
jgi:hypothetical protein